jgi:hypothetical protein
MIRPANENDIEMITQLIDAGVKLAGKVPTDIKEVVIYEDDNAKCITGVLCTSKNMKEVVAYGGSDYNKLIRYFQYINYNRRSKEYEQNVVSLPN